MKTTRILSLALALIMIFSAMALSSCKKDDGKYTVGSYHRKSDGPCKDRVLYYLSREYQHRLLFSRSTPLLPSPVPHRTGPGGLHGAAPLGCQLAAALLGKGVILPGFAHHREAHVAHALPVHPNGVIDLAQQFRQKGHTPQKGYAVGGVGLWVKGGE